MMNRITTRCRGSIRILVGSMSVVGFAAVTVGDGCWELTNQGWGCDNAGAELLPGERILETTINILQNGIRPATGPGKTGASGSYDVVCEQKIGVLNGSGLCVESQGQTVTHTGYGNDQWLVGDNCNPQPGGGG